MTKLLTTSLRGIAEAAPGLLHDLAGLGGVGLVAYGAWLTHPPAGFIVGGSLLILGVPLLPLGHRTTARTGPKTLDASGAAIADRAQKFRVCNARHARLVGCLEDDGLAP